MSNINRSSNSNGTGEGNGNVFTRSVLTMIEIVRGRSYSEIRSNSRSNSAK